MAFLKIGFVLGNDVEDRVLDNKLKKIPSNCRKKMSLTDDTFTFILRSLFSGYIGQFIESPL